MDGAKYNGRAWDEEVRRNNWWTRIIGKKQIEQARNGHPGIWITPSKCMPEDWTDAIIGKKVLLLASAGGQQTPLLAAAGCRVTSLDISPLQIKQDEKALGKYRLDGECLVGDMTDLSRFDDASFDVVLTPHSLNWISDLDRLYDEVERVLVPGGTFLLGSPNPAIYIFDEEKMAKGKMKVKYTIPFSDEASKSREERKKMKKELDTFEWSHTLDSILGGLTRRGFSITGFYSDDSGCEITDSFVHDSFIAVRAVRNQAL